VAVEKTNTSYFEETGNRLSNTSQLKLFPIFLDNDRETKFLNLFRSYKLNEDVQTDVVFFGTHEVSNDEFWDDIAYKLYGVPQLWWVIALINNVVNPFEELSDGDNIKILKEDYIYNLIKDLEQLSDL